MAVTYTNLRTVRDGAVKEVLVDVAWDSSYASGGEAIALADLGLSRLDFIEPTIHTSSAGVTGVKWDGSVTSPKLKLFGSPLTGSVSHYQHPLTSLATGLSTSAIDILTAYTPGYAFKLLGFDFVTTVAGTGASASQTFNLEIGTTNVTGGVLTLTLASQATIGTVTSATAITAANTGTATDTISIEMAASGTVFTAGAGYFVIKIQNLDTFGPMTATSDLSTVAVTGTIRAYGA